MRTRLPTAALTLALGALAACASPAAEAPTVPSAQDAPAAEAEAASAAASCPWCGQALPPGRDPVIVVNPDGCIRGPVIWTPLPTDGLPDLPTLYPLPEELPPAEALRRARVDGAYRGEPLRRIAVPADHAFYGAFYDWGRWEGTAYAGHVDLPPGDWVYVYPHWYIWESAGGR